MSPRSVPRLFAIAAAAFLLTGCSSYTTDVASCGYGAFGRSCDAANAFLELRVSTATTGTNLPSGLYGVRVMREACIKDSQIGPNVSITTESCGEGSNTVELRNVPANCTVTGGSTRAVTVTTSSLPTAQFEISCV